MSQERDPRAMHLFETERRRQIEVEGWTPEHDDEHANGEMLRAGVLYMNHGTEYFPTQTREDGAPFGWPWDASWWKPKDRRSNLVRAGALMLAEKDRIQRAADLLAAIQPNVSRPYRPPHFGHVDQKLEIAERELLEIVHKSAASRSAR